MFNYIIDQKCKAILVCRHALLVLDVRSAKICKRSPWADCPVWQRETLVSSFPLALFPILCLAKLF